MAANSTIINDRKVGTTIQGRPTNKLCPSLRTSFQGSSLEMAAPKDKYHSVYICMLMAGAGFLVPWTSYLGALDYFFYYYKRDFNTVSVIIPNTYLVTTFLAATLNLVVLVKYVPIHYRIIFGYVMFFISLLLIPILDIFINTCKISTSVAFYITLLTIGLVGLGSGVQQTSYYGLSNMLPRRYTQAVMAGESIAGVMESIFRIVTKITTESERIGGITFFSISLAFIVVCVGCHQYIKRSKIVKYYTRKCQQARQSSSDQPLSDSPKSDRKEKAGAKAEDQQPLIEDDVEEKETRGSELENSREEVLTNTHPVNNVTSQHLSVGKKIVSVVGVWAAVVVQIWALMAAIFIAYFVTLLLFPGIIAMIQDCSLGTWTPVLLVAVFNFTDLVAKWFTLLRVRWKPKQLLLASICRMVLIPLILICVSPSPSNPLLGSTVLVWAIIFTLLLAFTNGYFGSLPIIVTSAYVKDDRDKELAGTIMAWILLLGLVAGSSCAYALTPLTMLHEAADCSSNTTSPLFDLCSHGNGTLSL